MLSEKLVAKHRTNPCVGSSKYGDWRSLGATEVSLLSTAPRRLAQQHVRMAAKVEPGASDAAGILPLLAGEYQDIGGRKQQEDRCVCVADLNELVAKHRPEVSTDVRRAFFAVFDGFGGFQASEWLKEAFHVKLVTHESFADDPAKALQAIFAPLDAELLEVMEGRDQQKNKGNPVLVRCGSCATACLVVGNEVFVANIGDSSCVVYRRKGSPPPLAEMLTIDHKAGLQSERDRIAAAGGSTEQKTHDIPGFLCWKTRTVNVGPVRVQPGGLAVSRGFGAGHAKVHAAQPAHSARKLP